MIKLHVIMFIDVAAGGSIAVAVLLLPPLIDNNTYLFSNIQMIRVLIYIFHKTIIYKNQSLHK